MYISKLQIKNYMSFSSSEEINLLSGFNVIVGQNNVGKTALLEALSLHITSNPHHSLETKPRPGIPSLPYSEVNVAFQIEEGEAEHMLIDAGEPIFVPLPPDIEINNFNRIEFADKFRERLRSSGLLRCCYRTNHGFVSAYLDGYSKNNDNLPTMRFNVGFTQGQGKLEPVLEGGFPIGVTSFGINLANAMCERIYLFRAERLNVSTSPFGYSTTLQSNASNLAEVLHNMQNSNPARFRRFNEHVSIIFPQIKFITVPPSFRENNGVQILVWSVDPATEREDLAVPLSKSGTGIGQVLAILYVVLSAQYPQTIVIDEPQSFLHPGAVRKLIEILKQHPQHQFIITTHSSEIVSASNCKVLLLLRKEEFETKIETLDSTEVKDLQILLSEVGVRLSDVFGADNILWVEGSTEEQCFPLIVEKLLKQPLRGTKIMSVLQTGDFEGRHSGKIFQIYNRLSTGRWLVPPAIGFIFDREGRSEREQEDLKRRSQGRVVFLPRRMYENYLLNIHAISFIISNIENFREKQVTYTEIAEWVEENRWNKKYLNKDIPNLERTEEKWLQEVHGAKILNDLFQYFSERRFFYDKVKHGIALTEWIIENNPSDLVEVEELIRKQVIR
ncbi:AAA family ATPase [Dictyobacter aurantiacus]|uniref:ATPase AAA-type core domain-containing protein n=1 Tax=Dictyobacter aurantiacus TaxID=1936993 RepID=A0A401ZFW2_9CHLR|nr:AAA family ATPase [Dictyobacter aurantiacus]GCE05752.1 hypothetical protein KDAU_30810 [Dictyobacter aurantiacus]